MMISTVSSSYSNPAWAEYRNGILVAIPKFGEEMNQAILAQREKDIAATEAFMKKYQANGAEVNLTREQLNALSADYDPKKMSYKEYMSFIDRLCEYGVLDEGDKDYVAYSAFGSDLELIPLKYDLPVSTRGPRSTMGYDSSFVSSRGNVMDWSRHLAQFETYNIQTHSFQKTRSAILFGKIQDVLLKMGG